MPIVSFNLNGEWKLTDTDHCPGKAEGLTPLPDSGTQWIAAQVPGDIHPDLVAAGRLADPLWAMNFEQCTWTIKRDWWYRREIFVPETLKGRRFELVLDGIDTYSVIFVNGVRMGETNNMFLAYRFDVTQALRFDTANMIDICVRATEPIIEANNASPYFACFHSHRIFARKAQCQFSWDWAPHLPGLGIWRGVRLDALEEGVIQDVCVRSTIHAEGQSAEILFEIALDQYGKKPEQNGKPWQLDIEVRGNGVVLRKRMPVVGGANFVTIQVPNPKRWWPNGYGEPFLYTYSVTLKRGKETLDKKIGRLGIREIKLVEQAIAGDLLSFRFRVNGIDVFCQGANWVPADCFPGTISRERYVHLTRLIREADFNMLRVWGGGIYEDDAFYDLCDEQGILIFQDLMFACSDIPDDQPEFVMAMIPEFEYQVKRLRNHPCIAHWSGGNENSGAFNPSTTHYGDTLTRYIGRGVVAQLMPDLAYTPSSPSSHTDIGNDPQSGDSHGGVWEEAFVDDMRHYRQYVLKRKSMFHSEFGYHGPCQLRSLKKFIPADKLWPQNDIWECHVQDNPYSSLDETYSIVQNRTAELLFHKPQSAADFVKTAGTAHAEIVRDEFEHFRHSQPITMGALVWMMNDCWPCASWALVDYYGLPKQAYYAMKRACAPVLASFRQDTDTIDVLIVSRLGHALKGTLEVVLQTVDGKSKVLKKRTITVGERTAVQMIALSTKSIPDWPNAYLCARFRYGTETAETIFFHKLWKDIAWPEPELKVKAGKLVKREGEYEATVLISTKRFARCVNLVFKQDQLGYFSDNFFDMTPGATKRVVIRSKQRFIPETVAVRHWLTEWD